ncbi:hypothetical protein JP74_21960 [Devosia sp. 17-2-E-8]|nr:hypothetical protein JP74_21960 [Devosia sp. 17-2-E-8]
MALLAGLSVLLIWPIRGLAGFFVWRGGGLPLFVVAALIALHRVGLCILPVAGATVVAVVLHRIYLLGLWRSGTVRRLINLRAALSFRYSLRRIDHETV